MKSTEKNNNNAAYGVFLQRLMRMGLISIGIGILISVYFSGGHVFNNMESMLFNIGYSLTLGLSLFTSGDILNLFKNRYLKWVEFPVRSLIISVIIMTIYSSIIILIINWLWYIVIFNHSWNDLFGGGKSLLIIEYIVFCIVALFSFARQFFNEWKQSLIAEQQLKEEAIRLQYKVLSNQVNPHFLFNALNVLNSLIAIDTTRAQNFASKLSSFYRDLLNFKEKDIINIDEELRFVSNYIALQKERFGENIIFVNHFNSKHPFLVIPMTIQTLVENAIKHNQITRDKKLTIEILEENDYVVVKNNLQPYINPQDGEKFGLVSLQDRYQFLTDRKVIITKNEAFFMVKIPLLKAEQN